MSRVLRRRWAADGSGLSRRDRRSCEYETYVPDPLVGRAFALDAEVAADVSEAEAAIASFNAAGASLLDTEALARILLRAESVASSRMEGLEVCGRRLLRLEAALELGESPSDVTAGEVLANIEAMAEAVKSVQPGDTITLNHLLDFHQRLLAGTRLEEHAGRIRTEQNWIGGSGYSPCAAEFVPPPHEHVGELLDDLCSFCNLDDLPTVAQAALAHAQFETIHPFVDGNGRTGRALIHMIFRRRGLATHVLTPVSLVLATWARDYIAGLTATRYRGKHTSKDAHDGANLWMGLFAGACRRAVADATEFEHRAQRIEARWREEIGRVRSRSAADLLLHALLGAPVLTVTSASALIGRSFPQTNEAMSRLVDAGILRQVTAGKRNRAFEAPEIIDAFTDLERQLASPGGDTRSSGPSRRVPRRPAPRRRDFGGVRDGE